MKRLATFVFAMLLASSLSFAQAGGDKPKTDKGTTTDTGKKSKKTKKSKKKKGSDSTPAAPSK